jgi:hypothetical protein
MKNLTKEKLALLTIHSDAIHDILIDHDFVTDLKQAFNNIERSTKYIMKRSYGNQSLENFDEYKQKIQSYLLEVINGKFELKNENSN